MMISSADTHLTPSSIIIPFVEGTKKMGLAELGISYWYRVGGAFVSFLMNTGFSKDSVEYRVQLAHLDYLQTEFECRNQRRE